MDKGDFDFMIWSMFITLLLILGIQLFLKPTVIINDRDWDILIELEKLENRTIYINECSQNEIDLIRINAKLDLFSKYEEKGHLLHGDIY